MISAFTLTARVARRPDQELGTRGPSRRAELRGHLPQNAFAQNSMLPYSIVRFRTASECASSCLSGSSMITRLPPSPVNVPSIEVV